MAYNEKLAERIRNEFGEVPFVEKKMFDGVGFLVRSNIPALASGASAAVGVHKQDMIVRMDPDKHEKFLKKSHVKVFDITGRPMKGWLMVELEGCQITKQVNAWVKRRCGVCVDTPAEMKAIR